MADTCCQLVGDLDLGLNGCFISMSNTCSTEIGVVCGSDPQEGPTVGTLSLSAYADDTLWIGCPSKAGVSISYMRKYDCNTDTLHFIFNGQGQSFYTGEANRFVSLNTVLATSCETINASSSSGPASLYSRSTQYNGYGLTYNGDPINFTTTAQGTIINLGGIFAGTTYYLQSFNLELTPGQLPVVSYSLVYDAS
jgi:hypothetical protein